MLEKGQGNLGTFPQLLSSEQYALESVEEEVGKTNYREKMRADFSSRIPENMLLCWLQWILQENLPEVPPLWRKAFKYIL